MRTKIRLIPMPGETGFVPLGVLGYCLTRTKFLEPMFSGLELQIKKIDHEASDKVLDVLVSILAGCRAIYQVDTRLRPDLALAQAWGRGQFASQSNLARTLDAFGEETVGQLRQGSEALFRRESRTLRHNFEQEWLWLDIDLTPLPASKSAQGSAKGKISGKKIAMVANWLGCMRPSTTKPYSHSSILVSSIAVRLISRWCKPYSHV
jgi:hypothetical protein